MIYGLSRTVVIPGKMPESLEIGVKELIPLYPKVGLKLVGSWHGYTGNMNELYSLFVFDDLRALQNSRELQRTVKEYQILNAKLNANRVSQTNTILEPNPWSPLK